MSLRVMSLRGALVLSRSSLLFNEQFLSRKHLRLTRDCFVGTRKIIGAGEHPRSTRRNDMLILQADQPF
jgi:hypothetical protein